MDTIDKPDKLCIHCKHLKNCGGIAMCNHPLSSKNEVNGLPRYTCMEERGLFGKCQGNRFEERPPEENDPDRLIVLFVLPLILLVMLMGFIFGIITANLLR